MKYAITHEEVFTAQDHQNPQFMAWTAGYDIAIESAFGTYFTVRKVHNSKDYRLRVYENYGL